MSKDFQSKLGNTMRGLFQPHLPCQPKSYPLEGEPSVEVLQIASDGDRRAVTCLKLFEHVFDFTVVCIKEGVGIAIGNQTSDPATHAAMFRDICEEPRWIF